MTRDGVHYVNGVPLAESVFGNDPFDPVDHSRVEDIIHQQTDRQVYGAGPGEDMKHFRRPGNGKKIEII